MINRYQVTNFYHALPLVQALLADIGATLVFVHKDDMRTIKLKIDSYDDMDGLRKAMHKELGYSIVVTYPSDRDMKAKSTMNMQFNQLTDIEVFI